MTDSEYNVLVRYMRTQRTQTPSQVHEWAREHDSDDFTVAELLAPYGD